MELKRKMNKALGLVLGLVLAFGIIGCEKVEQMVAPVGPIGEEVGEVTEEPTVEIIQTDNLFELVGQKLQFMALFFHQRMILLLFLIILDLENM